MCYMLSMEFRKIDYKNGVLLKKITFHIDKVAFYHCLLCYAFKWKLLKAFKKNEINLDTEINRL